MNLRERHFLRLNALKFLQNYPEIYSIGYDRGHGYCINREFLPTGFYLKEGIGANSKSWLLERDYKEERIREIFKWLSDNLDPERTYIITKPERYS